MWRKSNQHVEITRDNDTDSKKTKVFSAVSTVIHNTNSNYTPSYKDQIRAERLAELNASTIDTNPCDGSSTIAGSSKLVQERIDPDVQYKDQIRFQNNVDYTEESCATGSLFNTTVNKITAMHERGRVIQTQIKSSRKSNSYDPDLQYKDQIRQQMSDSLYEEDNLDTRYGIHKDKINIPNPVIHQRVNVQPKSTMIDADLQYKDQIRQQMADSLYESTIETNYTSPDEKTTTIKSKKSTMIDADLQYKDQIRQQMADSLYESTIETTCTLDDEKRSYDNKPKSSLIDPDLQYKDQIRQQMSNSVYESNRDTSHHVEEATMPNAVRQQSSNVSRSGKVASTDPDVQYKNQIRAEMQEDVSVHHTPDYNSNVSGTNLTNKEIQSQRTTYNKNQDEKKNSVLESSLEEKPILSQERKKSNIPTNDSDLHYKDQILIREAMAHSVCEDVDSPYRKVTDDDVNTMKSDTAQKEKNVEHSRNGNNELLYKDQIHQMDDSDLDDQDCEVIIPERRPNPTVQERGVRPGAFRRYRTGIVPSNTQEDSIDTDPTITNIQANDPSESSKFEDDDLNHLAVAVPVEESESIDGKLRPEAIEFDPDQKWTVRKRRTFRVWMTILFVVVMVSIVAGIVSSRNRQNGTQTKPNPRLELGIAEFVSSQISLYSFSINSTDALQKALDWIILDDPMQLTPSDHPNFMRRYALAYMYYALSEKDWKYCSPNPDLPCRTGFEGNYNYNSFRWLSDTDECLWSGIECDINYNHVNVIFLTEIGLTGEVTANLDLFPFLHFISLNKAGKVTGNLSHLNNTKCKHLQMFYVAKNQLTGPLPSFVLQWRSLVKLDISKNKLTGDVNFQNLNKDIKSVDISKNKFSQSPITETDILRIRNIKSFTVRNNKFTGKIPQSLFALPYIKTIDFGRNQFTGTIPYMTSTLKSVTGLWLEQNRLTGTIPETIYDLKQLKSLALNDNNLKGTISTKIGQLSSILSLLFHSNKELSGTIPTEIGILSQLNALTFSGTNLTGAIPNDLCRYRTGKLASLTADCMIVDDVAPKVDCSCCSSCCAADGGTCTIS